MTNLISGPAARFAVQFLGHSGLEWLLLDGAISPANLSVQSMAIASIVVLNVFRDANRELSTGVACIVVAGTWVDGRGYHAPTWIELADSTGKPPSRKAARKRH